MDKMKLIKDVKLLVGTSDNEKAVDLLISSLEQDKTYQDLADYAIHIKGTLESLKKSDLNNTITSEEVSVRISKVRFQIFDLLDRLEKGNLQWQASEVITQKATKNSNLILISSIIGVLLLGVGFLVYSTIFKDDPVISTGEPVVEESPCPAFAQNTPDAFNILLFPFLSFDSQMASTHKAISIRLAELAEKYDISLGVDFYNKGAIIDSDYPKNSNEATQKAKECAANLVIWGTEEGQADRTIIRTKYKFLNAIALSAIELTEDTEIDTVEAFSNIINGQELITENIENNIKLIFGILAKEQQKDDVAIEILDDIDSSDSTYNFIKEMLKADIYLNNEKTEQAYEAYNKVLETHPDYWLARKNRGMLNYKKAEYEASIEDLTAELAKRPTDTASLIVRGSAYTKTEQIRKAQEDLNTAKELDPKNRMIKQKFNELQETKKLINTRKIELDQQVKLNPSNVQATANLAQTYQHLGDYQAAERFANMAIKIDPNNLQSYVTKIETFIDQGKEKEAKAAYEDALKKNIDREKLLEASPAIRKLVQPSTNLIFRKVN